MSRFDETEVEISGIFAITKKTIKDTRGYLERLFCASDLISWSNRPVAQVNRTFTAKKGTIRGLHFQRTPHAEAKLVSCLRGRVMDFALDIRKDSPTFGKIFSIELDAEINNAVLLPEGIAHGFQTLTNDVEMLYFHSQPHQANHEAGVNIFDPELGLSLPIGCSLISERDQNFPLLKKLDEYF